MRDTGWAPFRHIVVAFNPFLYLTCVDQYYLLYTSNVGNVWIISWWMETLRTSCTSQTDLRPPSSCINHGNLQIHVNGRIGNFFFVTNISTIPIIYNNWHIVFFWYIFLYSRTNMFNCGYNAYFLFWFIRAIFAICFWIDILHVDKKDIRRGRTRENSYPNDRVLVL